MNEYMDILTFPHYELRYHERMSLENRAAQFAPFDALTGYKEEINEVKRLTTNRKILLEDELQRLDEMIQNIKIGDSVTIKYFIPDTTKLGGKYVEEKGIIKQLDSVYKRILLQGNKIIRLEQVIMIEKDF